MKKYYTISLCVFFTVLGYGASAQPIEDDNWFTFKDKLFGYNVPGSSKTPEIRKLFTNNSDFYVAGRISDIDGKFVSCIGKYNSNTKTWSDLDSGVGFYPNTASPTVRDFAVMPNGDVYIGDGSYDDAGGPRGYLNYNVQITPGFGAKFSGTSWSPYPNPALNGRLVVTEKGELYLFHNRIYKWSGSSFQEVSNENTYYYYQDGYGQELLKTKGDYIYFRASDSLDENQNWIKIFDTKTNKITKVSLRGSNGTSSWSPNAFAVDDIGNIYLGGKFTRIIDVYTDNIAKWDAKEQKWSGLGLGLNSDVYSLEIGINGELYAGGAFTKSGEKNLSHVAVWDGSSWDSLGSGIDASVLFIEIDKYGRVYCGGDFTKAGGKISPFLARWDKESLLNKPKLVVNTTDDRFDRSCDNDHCSLRDAIYVANRKKDKDTITFDINNGGEAIIELDSAMTEIVNPVSIDGTTQPGYDLKPLIRIDGNKIFNYANGFIIKSGYSEIKGLSITRFKGNGLFLYENGYNEIYSNFIGIDKNMTAGLGNKAGGINISLKSSHNKIGDVENKWNQIYGGVVISDTSENRGNRIVNNTIEIPLDKITNYPIRVPIDLGNDGPSCYCWDGCGLINNGIAPPRVLKLDKTSVEGMTKPMALVEVYVAEELGDKNGRYFARKVFPTANGYANGEGHFKIPIEFQNFTDEFRLVLSATDTEGNTSELSQAIRPVVFLPGVGGSWLDANDGTELWLPDGGTDETQNNNLFRMSLLPNGTSKEKVTSTKILENVGVGLTKTVFYGHILSWLGGNGGYHDSPNDSIMNDIWRFPYDFRLDLEGRADDLRKMIGRATSNNNKYAKSCEVDILSHSMGGVIASLYLKKYSDESKDKVNRFITLGTPYLGATKAMGVHLRGYLFGLDEQPIYGTGFDVRWDKMIEMARNMTASYALMPTRKYWEASSQFEPEEYLMPDIYGDPIVGYDATRQFLGAPRYSEYYTPTEPFGLGRNINLLDREDKNVHKDLVEDWRSWNQPPQIFRLLGKVRVSDQPGKYRSTPIFWFLNPRFSTDIKISNIPEGIRRFETGDESRTIIYRSFLQPALGDGDETVPLSSASIGHFGSVSKADFSGVDESIWIEEFELYPCTHTGLAEEDCSSGGVKIFDRIREILKSSSTINSKVVIPAASENKQEILYITASAPVAVSIFDSKNNHTGPTDKLKLNKIEYGLKGVGYWNNTFGTTVMLPDLDDYKVVVESPFADAEVQFIKLMSQPNDKLANAFYQDQKLTTVSKLIYEYKPSSQSPNAPIFLDTDGNGSVDKTIETAAVFESSSSVPAIPIPRPFAFDIGLFISEANTSKPIKITLPNTGGPSWNWTLIKYPAWVQPDKLTGTSPSEINAMVSFKDFQPGLHSDTLLIELKNQGYTAVYPIEVKVNVYSNEEVVKIEITPDFMELKTDSQFQFTGSALNQMGQKINSTITWEASGGTISQSGLYTAGGSQGVFNVIARGGSAADTIQILIDNREEIDDNPEQNEEIQRPHIKIYPNPFESYAKVRLNLDKEYAVKLKIFDLLGTEIKSLELTSVNIGNHDYLFDMQDIAIGTYVCRVEFSDLLTNIKVTKSRMMVKM